MTATIAQLNELLEAERAGVDAMSRLMAAAPTRELRAFLERGRDDEAWSCMGLAGAIKRLGGTPSGKKGDFAAKVLAAPSFRDRLQLLDRGQQWVVRRLDGLLATQLDEETERFLREMRWVHATNAGRCRVLLASLGTDHLGDVPGSHDEN
jgi:nitronate monooxygenase